MDIQPQISAMPRIKAFGGWCAGLPSRNGRPLGAVFAATMLLLLISSPSAGESPRVIPTILNTPEGQWDGEGDHDG